MCHTILSTFYTSYNLLLSKMISSIASYITTPVIMHSVTIAVELFLLHTIYNEVSRAYNDAVEKAYSNMQRDVTKKVTEAVKQGINNTISDNPRFTIKGKTITGSFNYPEFDISVEEIFDSKTSDETNSNSDKLE